MKHETYTALASELDSHYQKMNMQPVEFFMQNPSLNYLQMAVIKYVCRYKDKNKEQDLDKAIDCLTKLKAWHAEHGY
jgi:hypothetical protein